MAIIETILLGIIQGLTEFIPVSSSGHLVVLHNMIGTPQAGLAFDVALHTGTLLALLIFFKSDLYGLARGLFVKSPDTRLSRMLAFATVPAIVAGVLLQGAAESAFRSTRLVAVNLIVFGLIMLIAEAVAKRKTNPNGIKGISLGQAAVMGLSQALAVVPGVSRSGSTISGGLFAGLDRVSATRFSFLLAIPITLGAVLKVMVIDGALAQSDIGLQLLAIGVITAFASGLLAIKFLLKFLSKHSLATFAYYRIALGVVIIMFAMR